MDDVYAGSTEFRFGVKKETKDLEAEYAAVVEQLPLLKERMDYLDKQIAYYASVDSIPIDLDKDPTGHRNVMAVHKLMKDELAGEKSWLETRIKAYSKRRR